MDSLWYIICRLNLRSNLKAVFRQPGPSFLFLLLAGCWIFAINFPSRLPLPIWDEPLYSNGNFLQSPDWSPLYRFLYFLLNSITRDRILSFDIMTFGLCFTAYPAVSFLLTRRLGLGAFSAFLFSLFVSVSAWNFPLEPKVFLMNHTLLLLALFFRLGDRPRLFLSYLLFGLAIWVRYENLIFLGSFVLWDMWKGRKFFLPIKSIGLPILLALALGMLLTRGDIIPAENRLYHVYVDHAHRVFSENPAFSHLVDRGLEDWRAEAFGNAQNIFEAIRFNTEFFFSSKLPQAFQIPEVVLNALSLKHLHSHFQRWPPVLSLLFVLALAFFGACFSSQASFQKQDLWNLGIYATAVVFKVCFVVVLASPMLKYSFELAWLSVLAVFLLAPLLIPQWRLVSLRIQQIVGLAVVFSLFAFNSKKMQLKEFPSGGREIVRRLIALSESDRKIYVLMGQGGLWPWVEDEIYWTSPNRICPEVRTSLRDCLRAESIDAIVIDHDFRFWSSTSAFSKEYRELEADPRTFGYVTDLSFYDNGARTLLLSRGELQ